MILSSPKPTSSFNLWSGPTLSQRTSMWGRRTTCFWWSPRWGTRLKCSPQTNTRSSVYKGEPHEMSKCRKKINLDVANFKPNKSTTQIWVTHHQYGISGLVLWTCHVGGGGKQLWRREMSASLFLRLPVLRFASIRAKPSLCVKEDRPHLNCKSFSLGKILLSQM